MFWETKKQQKQNEEIDRNLIEFVEAMGDASISKFFLIVSAVVTIFCWFFVLLFSNIAVYLYEKLGGFTSTPVMVAFCVPFFAGFLYAYAFFRRRFPDMEEDKLLESDLMASIKYQNNSNKRWLLWIFSILTGLLNLALLIIAAIFLERNGFYIFDL